MEGTMKHVVIAGATGMVGREVVRLLHERNDVSAVALVRRPGGVTRLSSRIREEVFDFEDPEAYGRIGTDIPCDVFLCALGTTLGQAGSHEAFRKVDRDMPMSFMCSLLKVEPRPVFGVVSAAGAAHPRGFYLRTKAEMEKALFESGLPYVIVRPGLLLGERTESRPLERMASLLARPYLYFARAFAPQSRFVWKYAPVEAEVVARALVSTTLDLPAQLTNRVLSGLSIQHPILGLD